MNELEQFRKEIDIIDREMAALFDKRMDICIKIGQYKQKSNMRIRDFDREKKIITTNEMYVKDGYQKYYRDFISNVLKQSRKLQLKSNRHNNENN